MGSMALALGGKVTLRIQSEKKQIIICYTLFLYNTDKPLTITA